MKKLLLVSMLFCWLTACFQSKKTTSLQQNINVEDHQIFAVLFQQHAAEYRALCYQAFNCARIVLASEIVTHKGAKPLAVISDIDETLLDNSPELADRIIRNIPYSHEHWLKWTMHEKRAKALPGAVEFLKYADSMNIKIFYISNRTEEEKAATIDNMKNLGFPQLDATSFLLKSVDKSSSDKELRRQTVLLTHDIVLLLGDNLGDFISAKLPISRRNELADSLKATWSLKNIVLPNPCYGGWEEAIRLFKNNLTKSQIDSLRRNALIR